MELTVTLEGKPENGQKVALVAECMAERLHDNEAKGGWAFLSWRQAMECLRERVHELEQACIDLELRQDGAGPHIEKFLKVTNKMADVQNYSMFVADNIGALKAYQEFPR